MKQQDASLYLNYPGLKYLNKMNNISWDTDSFFYLAYEGLKYLGGKPYNFNNQNKVFLSLDGLDYMLFSRMFPVLEEYKEEEDQELYRNDSSIYFDYDYASGEIILISSTTNNSLFVDENNEVGNIDKSGSIYFMAYKNRGINGSYTINENGEIIHNA